MKNLLLGAAFVAGLLPAAVQAQSILFINPGKSDEAYWTTAASAMQSAAKSLDMKLEVRFTERDHTRTLDVAREVAARPAGQRPEYAIITNDNATGPALLRILDRAGVKTLFAFSSLTVADRAELGGPRQKFKGWLGSIEPRAEDAGYLTGKALIGQARKANARASDGRIHLIALAGDRTTPSSIRRNEGFMRAVSEAGDAVVDQMVYAGWSREKGAEQAEWLFKRYPGTRVVWAGNDLMAFGAMQAWERQGGTPGRDAWFSGVNTSKEAMEAIRSGRLAALAGGHFIQGAWAVVLIHDHARGHDFAAEALEFDRTMFTLFDPASAERYLARFGSGFESIDFRSRSKALNPQLRRYDFDFGQFLR